MTVYVIADSDARFERAKLGANLTDEDDVVKLVTDEDIRNLHDRWYVNGDTILYAGIPDIETDFTEELKGRGFPV